MTVEIFAARQPILDRDLRVVGYELLYRQGAGNRFVEMDAEVIAAYAQRVVFTQRLRRNTAMLLAEKVDTHADVREPKALGYSLFQGLLFARPEMLRSQDRSPGRLTYLRLAQQDVTLTLELLRSLHSATFAGHDVGSISQAILTADALMDRSLAEALDPLGLCAEVRSGILEQRGPFGPCVELARIREQGEWDREQPCLDRLGLAEEVVPAAHAHAVLWAEAVAQP